MPRLTSIIRGEGALHDYCPVDGNPMDDVVQQENHTSYSGECYLYFLKCQNKHKWLRVITQNDGAPPTSFSGWETEFDK